MSYDPMRHHRRSIRLRSYDYTNVGAYFITICGIGRGEIFGTLVEGKVQLNACGNIAGHCWEALATRYSYVALDEWIVMPDHFHGILVLQAMKTDANNEPALPIKRKPVGRLVGVFKTTSTGAINNLRGTPRQAVWQRDYYEHIIRNEDELRRIRNYIRSNPQRWRPRQTRMGA